MARTLGISWTNWSDHDDLPAVLSRQWVWQQVERAWQELFDEDAFQNRCLTSLVDWTYLYLE